MQNEEISEARVARIKEGNTFRELNNYVSKSWDVANEGEGSANELWSEEFKAWVDGDLLKSLFFSEDWVFIAVDLIASKISGQPLRVVTKKTVDGQIITEPAPDHPLNKLLEQPNPWQDYAQWMYNTTVELFLMGNGIIWHAPNSGQLLTLNTENVTMNFDKKGQVNEYVLSNYQEDNGYRQVDVKAAFKQKDIMHLRRPNPNSLLWGLSPFIPGRKSILFNRYSTDYLNSFYLKQATPGLALEMDRSVNEDVALRQLRSFEVAYQGRKNQRRTLVLPKGVKATPLTHSLADQKLLDHINTNRETLLGLLKIPKHELGLQTSGSLGSEEYKIAIRNFWESTLKPAMDMIQGTMNKFFQAELGEDHYFEFDLSDVEALQDNLQKKADTAKSMLQAGLSINEVRQQVWKVEAFDTEAADMPFNLAQLRSSTLAPVQPGQLPAAREEPQEPEEKMIRKLGKSSRVAELRAKSVKQLEDEEASKIGTMSELAIDFLTAMTARALEIIEENIIGKDLIKFMGGYDTKQDLPSKRVLKRRIKNAIEEDFESSWQNDIARTLSSSIDTGYDGQVDLVFNQQATQEIQALKERDEEGRRLTLEARGLESFAQISEAHTERIMRQITTGQKKGESITQIMRRVANSLGTPGDLAGRAETIARTETLTALSIGQAAAAENAGEVIPGMKKSWLTAGDDRVRDSHAGIDGDVIGVKEKFDNGLRHPRDIKFGGAEDNINCRCTLLLVAPEDEDILLNGV